MGHANDLVWPTMTSTPLANCSHLDRLTGTLRMNSVKVLSMHCHPTLQEVAGLVILVSRFHQELFKAEEPKTGQVQDGTDENPVWISRL